jgi:hypothetical protein
VRTARELAEDALLNSRQRPQAELRAKQDEDAREKEAALQEMKVLADKLLMEGYARQAALADLKAREDRIKHQIALLSKSFLSFSSQSPSSAAHAATATADHDADVARCIDGIKRLQMRHHSGANEAVLISQLGLAINPKVCSACPPLLSRVACIPHFQAYAFASMPHILFLGYSSTALSSSLFRTRRCQ